MLITLNPLESAGFCNVLDYFGIEQTSGGTFSITYGSDKRERIMFDVTTKQWTKVSQYQEAKLSGTCINPKVYNGDARRNWMQDLSNAEHMQLVMDADSESTLLGDHKRFAKAIGFVYTAILSQSMSFEQARAREARLCCELTKHETFIRKLAAVVTVGLYSSSTLGTITYANERFYTLVNTEAGQVGRGNQSILQFIHEEDQTKVQQALETCLQQRCIQTVDVRLKKRWKPPGEESEQHCWVAISITPSSENDKNSGIVGCLTDVSHNMWALQLQKESTEAAEKAKRDQERFIDVTSHEMRNPLSAIAHSADSIISSAEAIGKILDMPSEHVDDITESAKIVLLCVAHQKNIIDDISTVSKLNSTLLQINPVLMSPSTVVQKVINMFAAESLAEEIVISFVSKDRSSCVYCDTPRLTQILVNLISNSIKFTKSTTKREIVVEASSSPTICPVFFKGIRWYPKDEAGSNQRLCGKDEIFLCFKVTDTGSGMNLDQMNMLFERFTPMTHITYSGSGLGLFISRELTELHGGLIGASSLLGSGSTFALYIKVRTTPVPKSTTKSYEMKDSTEITITELHTPRTHKKAKKEANYRDMSILVVEDNLINQKVLQKQLQRLGCSVVVANHGLEALEYIKSSRHWHNKNSELPEITAILMDSEMPVCDGISCTRQIRQYETEGYIKQRLPIIATTANARQAQMDDMYEAGVVSIMSNIDSSGALTPGRIAFYPSHTRLAKSLIWFRN